MIVYTDTLNKLLGSADYVTDIKKGFIQNLCTPSNSNGFLTYDREG